MVFSRLDSRSQIIYYSTGADIDSLINISRLNTKNKNDVRFNLINSNDSSCLNHIRSNNCFSQQNKNNIWWVGSDYSKINNFTNKSCINHQTREKDIKEKNTSKPNSFFELLGGKHQEWKLEKHKLSQRFLNGNIPIVEEIMGEIVYALKHIDRTNFPIFLDPKTASFIQVAQHAKIRQYLSDNTIIKNIRYARFMELHNCPINFRNLTPETVLKHFDYRIQIENATANSLAHEKKAIMMFLRSYGLKQEETELWSQVLKTPPVIINDKIDFVYPQNVNKFYIYERYSNKKNYDIRVYENKLFQHIAFMGFNFGMRCPSEIVTLTLDDVIINKDGSGHITIHEQKKRGRTRDIIPYSKKILSSTRYKTPKNYRDNWRPKVKNDESGNAFFLQWNGKPITEKYVRDHLSASGKKITGNPNFTPYHMRHTFATYLYQYTKNIKKVAKRLGHTKTANTDKYVDVAEDLEEQFDGKNLFNIALKPQNLVGGKQIKQQVTLICTKK